MKTQILKSIFLFCILNYAFTNISNAQLIYTDIIPDYTLGSNTIYQLDLNNDGTNDFEFSYSRTASGTCGGIPRYVNTYARVTALNSGFQGAKHLGAPAALNLDDTILGWMTPVASLLLHGHFDCGQTTTGFNGNWNSTSDHYLGVKFSIGSDWYYGWVRMNIIGAVNPGVPIDFTIRDYAFQSTPNQPIFAEETTTGINELSMAGAFSVFPNPFSLSTTVKFHLLKKEPVSLKIFDLSGRLIKTLADNTFEEGEHTLEWNVQEANAGIYFLQILSTEFSKMEKLIVSK